MEIPKNLLNTDEAAKFLNVSRVTLARARAYGKPQGPPFIRWGRTIRYELDDLLAFVEARKVSR
jgi:hypothetical protein